MVVIEGEKLQTLVPELPVLDRQSLSHPVDLLRDLEGELGGLRLQLLPYRAVGVECGMLLALRVDRARYGPWEYRNCLTALSPPRCPMGADTAPSSADGREPERADRKRMGGSAHEGTFCVWYLRLCQWLARHRLWRPGKIMYIGGSDVLPAPLSREEEGSSSPGWRRGIRRPPPP